MTYTMCNGVTADAWRFGGNKPAGNDTPHHPDRWLVDAEYLGRGVPLVPGGIFFTPSGGHWAYVAVGTQNGQQLASVGDWIVRLRSFDGDYCLLVMPHDQFCYLFRELQE